MGMDRLSPLRSVDLGPTIAARLEVELDGVDGRPVPWLARDR